MVRIIDTKEIVNMKKRVITTIITDEYGHKFIGQSWCSVEDEFNEEFGSKLSYLRAKKHMIKAYNNENKRYHKSQLKGFEDYCKRMETEIAKYDNALDKTEQAINDMLN
mgnify:CR=1 FL=1